MLRFIEKPHLPQGAVRHIIIGEKYQKCLEKSLIEHNLTPIWLKNNDFVDERLSGHCDLMAAHLGGKTVVTSEFLNDSHIFGNLCVEQLTIQNPTDKLYPMDAGLNFCIVGDKLEYNPKTACESAVSLLKCEKIPCKQGYTKCSICVVDENSIITADSKIAQSAAAHGIDALLVDKRLSALDGFDYGFIGGASFKIGKNKLAFTGNINNVTERERIESFLNKRGIEAVYLTSNGLFDIGSAIPLTEEAN